MSAFRTSILSRKVCLWREIRSYEWVCETIVGLFTWDYTDAHKDEKLPNNGDLIRKPEMKIPFVIGRRNDKEGSSSVCKTKWTGSSTGQNGASYKLFKYCLNVLCELWNVLRMLWWNRLTPSECCIAKCIYIPTKKDCMMLDQFGPTPLIKGESNIFFGGEERHRSCLVPGSWSTSFL